MDHRSARRQRLWDAMESCRGNSNDLSDPAFAELAARLAEDAELQSQFQRLQRADGAIQAAFAAVPIPTGLAVRVSQRLAKAEPTVASAPQPEAVACQAAPALAAPAVPVSDSPTPLRAATGRFSRRGLLTGFTALAAGTALLVAVWVQTHRVPPQTRSAILDEAMDFFDRDQQPEGELISRVSPPADYPISRDIARLQGIRWRYVRAFPGGRAVAYDLPADGGRATLYVLDRSVAGMPPIPPDRPLSTGGKSAAAWQTGNMLYVLVVEGDAGTYSNYLDHSHGPLT